MRLDSANVLSLSNSLRPTGSSSIFKSIRSSSGPEIRPWYLRRAAGLQLHPSFGPAIFAHGHGFAARTRVNLAGNVAMTPNLATTTSPASSGCRSASSTSLANSGASSRNRTPRWASDAEPGRIIPLPPPTIAALVAVWCGARKGGSVSSETWGGKVPATECMAVTSSAAAVSRRGNMVGIRSASIVLPAPGGPSSDR